MCSINVPIGRASRWAQGCNCRQVSGSRCSCFLRVVDSVVKLSYKLGGFSPCFRNKSHVLDKIRIIIREEEGDQSGNPGFQLSTTMSFTCTLKEMGIPRPQLDTHSKGSSNINGLFLLK